MGKDLKGRNLGVGISQRKDGRYYVRVQTDGHIESRYFKDLQDAKDWHLEKSYNKRIRGINTGEFGTLNKWFSYWMTNIKQIRESSKITRTSYYNNYVKDVIGDIPLDAIKPIHCLDVLVKLKGKGYSNSVIGDVRSILHDCLECAVENDLIIKNPVNRSVKAEGLPKKDSYIMTKVERSLFLKETEKSYHYLDYAFVLETGVRCGELRGLKWQDIDFENKVIHIKRACHFSSKEKKFVETPTKNKHSVRTIPLTDDAIKILRQQKEKNAKKLTSFEYRDYVFTNRNGKPTYNDVYNRALAVIMEKMGLPKITMHTLRHTYATRCIEDGIAPKVLQTFLGHSNLKTTMDLYVHVTDEYKMDEIIKLQSIAV